MRAGEEPAKELWRFDALSASRQCPRGTSRDQQSPFTASPSCAGHTRLTGRGLAAGAARAAKLCALQDAAGRVEACPGEGCPFWEEGGAVLEGGCAIERLSLDLRAGRNSRSTCSRSDSIARAAAT